MTSLVALIVFGLIAVEVLAQPTQTESIPTTSKDAANAPNQLGVIIAAADATSAAQRQENRPAKPTVDHQSAGVFQAHVLELDSLHELG